MSKTPDSLEEIEAAALGERCFCEKGEEKPCVLDVRTAVEYHHDHLDGAVLMSLNHLDPAKVKEMRGGGDRPVYLVCEAGVRAAKAARKLESAGVDHCVVVDGGMRAWRDAGLPVIRSKPVVTIERQVRIAAGLLIVTGSLLAWFVHPAWVALPAFVGAGLAFAGITNTCGMGLIFLKAPWNNKGSDETSPPMK